MRSPSCSRSSSAALSPARWLFWLFALLSLCWAPRAHALTPSESAQIESIVADMLTARQSLAESRIALTDSRASATAQSQLLQGARELASRLIAQLQLWQEFSTELGDSLGRSSAELTTLRAELSRLTATYSALLRLHETSSLAAEKQIRDRERRLRVWRTVAVAGTIGALAVGFLAGVLAR